MFSFKYKGGPASSSSYKAAKEVKYSRPHIIVKEGEIFEMAKAIAPTPVLRGKDAEKFLELTAKAEKVLDRKREEFLRACFMLYSNHKF